VLPSNLTVAPLIGSPLAVHTFTVTSPAKGAGLGAEVVETVAANVLVTAMKALVALVCVVEAETPPCDVCAPFTGTTFRVLVLCTPPTTGACEGRESKRYPIPLFALLAVIVTSVESGTVAPKTLVKLPVVLV
jgi:hypothetical protein